MMCARRASKAQQHWLLRKVSIADLEALISHRRMPGKEAFSV